jgi:hypothetical protein
LQRSYGNSYVGSVIQAKLTVNQPGDIYEQEADRMAAQVVMPKPELPIAPVASVSQPLGGMGIQRQCSECEQGMEDGKDSDEMSSVTGVQTKLTVGAVGDKYEQEADRVAAQVMSMSVAPNNSSQVQRFGEEDNPVQRWSSLAQSITPVVQRQVDEQVQMQALVQRAFQAGRNEASGDLESRLNASKGGGSALAPDVRSFMEPRFGADFARVRVHTGNDAVQMNRELGAQAFAHGSDVYFGAGKSPGNNELTAHELTHVVQQKGDAVASRKVIQRKEVKKDSDIRGKQDWTTADRQNNTQRWKDACLTNLNAVDSSQYVKVVERRDFYKWFYEYSAFLGYTTRWALAAYVVANGAHQIADMDEDHSIANDTLGMANVELQGVMREGNQVIFDNVLPKLKKLIDGGSLKDRAALNWDMQVLAEEQTLIQPMYSRMSKETVEQLNYIARKKRFAGIGAAIRLPWNDRDDFIPKGLYNNEGIVPGFNQPNIQNIGDRWKYGMNLGNMFTPGGSGFDPNKDTMPAVGSGYQDGSELAKVDTRANLHKLDAWLNPNRLSHVGSGSDIQAIINSLSAFEKQQVLSDHSPDGWAYSTQFAQFSFITEAMVKQALPSEPSFAGAVAAFLARYKAERTQVEMKYPSPMYFPMGM